MRYRWIKREADLDYVFSAAERFFNNQEFCKISRVDKIRRELVVHVCPHGKGSVVVYVRIYKRSDGFEISFSVEEAILFGKMGFLSTMLGTGFFIKDKLRVVSIVDRVEEKFWLYMKDVVSVL